MPKKNFDNKNEQKQQLGAMLSLCRGKRSLREIARAIGISASNLSYIERGINAPSPEVYEKMISELTPSEKEHQEMDHLYSHIRGVPPPDVCEILVTNNGLNNALRLLGDGHISNDKLVKINELFASL